MTVAMAATRRGRGFEVGKDRLLLARAASFVRMRRGGSEVGKSGRVEKGEGTRSVVRVSLRFGGDTGRQAYGPVGWAVECFNFVEIKMA